MRSGLGGVFPNQSEEVARRRAKPKWRVARLADIAESGLGKMLDSRKNKGYPRPYLANVNVRWGRFDLDDLREMRFEEHESEKFGLRHGDIVMCEGGEPGRCALWKEQMPGMTIQKALHRIRAHGCMDSQFLYYNLFHRGRTGRFAPLFTGATIKHLPRQQLAKVEVDVPPMAVQKRIGEILSTYDELIENSQRRIALLEQAARELYREWFVRLRFPGHETTRIVNGIPRGWERVALENIGQLRYGRSLKAQDRIDGDYPVYGSSGIVGTHDTAHVTGPGIIIGRKGNVGSVYWSDDDFCAIDTVYYVEPSAVTLYLYYTIGNLDFINTDVAVPGLNRNLAHSRKFLLASVDAQEAFNEVTETIHKKIALLRKKNGSLEYARDLLLPRLMSGVVAV